MNDRLTSIQTPWDLIDAAQQGSPEAMQHCLRAIAEQYYAPIAAYIAGVSKLRNPEKIEDLTQGFFLKFLEKEIVTRLDKQIGPFRKFLKKAVRNYVLDEMDRAKRHNPASPLTELRNLPTDDVQSPEGDSVEEDFNRQWARQMMEQACAVFAARCFDNNTQHYHDVMDRFDLHPEKYGNPDYAAAAEQLGITQKDVANYLHRGRKAFREVLRQVVRATVRTDDEADQELSDMRRWFS